MSFSSMRRTKMINIGQGSNPCNKDKGEGIKQRFCKIIC